jgi:archaemetzincin
MTECKHRILQFEPSPFAELAGYTQASLIKRVAAATKSGRATKASVTKTDSTATDPIASFPAPLVLPFDDLNFDPDYEGQDFKSWQQYNRRNKVSAARHTIYIARVPDITKDVAYMSGWPNVTLHPKTLAFQGKKASSPNIDNVIEYISAFYHGMDVKELPTRLKWTSWEDNSQNQYGHDIAAPEYVGLKHGDETTRIRTRIPPDLVFSAQLNLNDILDGAIRALPVDAYALCLLVDHDIWEDDDDDFCCGRAYGGSRVCVVQTARYDPGLDVYGGIDRAHMWPLSHCKDFVDQICLTEDMEPQRPTQRQVKESRSGPMRKAVDAAMRKTNGTEGKKAEEALWLSRLARTVSHELAHCFAFDHCVYYACNLQGTAGIKEDVRQPPYLCPVCEAKISYAIAVERLKGDEEERKIWVRERCSRLREFCDRLESQGKGTAMWSGLDAWLEERMLEM